MRKSVYPRRLLPQARFKNMGVTNGFGPYYVVRLGQRKVHIKNKQDLKEHFAKHMQSKEFIDGVSVLLLSVFRKKDVLLRPDYKGHSSWEDDWDMKTSTPMLVEGISHEPHRAYFGFRIQDLSTVLFDYIPSKNIDNPSLPTMHLTLRVEHRPTTINFWHCNIYICEQNTLSDIRKKLEDKVIKRMAKAALPFIQKKALLPKAMKAKKIPLEKYYRY